MSVAVARIEMRDGKEVIKALDKLFDLLNVKIPYNISKIAIKPNLCYYFDYSTGETTDSLLIGALIDYIRDHVNSNVQIFIVESDATAMSTKYVFKVLGYEKLAKEKNVGLVNLSKTPFREVEVNGYYFKTFKKPIIFDDVDFYINVPKIKLHPLTKISCALKNQFGCNPISYKVQYHPHLNEVIADINSILRPSINIADGIIIKREDGPFKYNIIAASIDPVALDSMVATFAQYNPKTVKHLVLSSKLGIGTLSPKIVGEKINVQLRKASLNREIIRKIKKLMYLGYKSTMNFLLKVPLY